MNSSSSGESGAGAEVRRFAAGPEDAGIRLDVWLTGKLAPMSRSRVQAAIKRGEVLVNGSPADARRTLRPGDEVQARPEVPEPGPDYAPEPIPLSILFEDEHLIVLDKPPGLVMHPAPGHASGTLVNALLHRGGPGVRDAGGPGRCGIVHRLDNLTSGLLVAAKNPDAAAALSRDFALRRIQRRYIAISVGQFRPAEGTIDLPVGRRRNDRKLMGVVADGRPARTSFRALLEANGFSLVLVKLHTGRTHQIRVHFQAAGHPVLGDEVYGWTKQRTLMLAPAAVRNRLGADWPGRQMLHAAGLAFRHPATGEWLRFTGDPPDGMSRIIELLFGKPRQTWAEILEPELAEPPPEEPDPAGTDEEPEGEAETEEVE